MLFNKEFQERFEKEFGDASVKVNPMKSKAWFSKNEDIKNYLEDLLANEPRYGSFGNAVWAFRNNFDISSYKCKNCGKLMTLNHSATQKSDFCSAKCAMTSKDVQDKRKETIFKDIDYYQRRDEKTKKTSLERYGVEHPCQAESVKKKIKDTALKDPDHWNKRYENTKKTCLERYGVENPSQSQEIKDKKTATCLEHYGVTNSFKSKEIREKIKKTCLERYGVENPFKRKEVIEKTIEKSWTTIQSWKEFVVPNFTREEYTGYSNGQVYEWKCMKCGHIFKQSIYHTKHMDFSQLVPRCEKCYPKDYVSSVREKDLLDFVRLYFPNASKSRELIAPLELDIVIPEIKVAIEFNGDYWHSDSVLADKNYHLMKQELCKEKGYRLIHIFEHEWKFKKEIVKKKLKSIFGISTEKVYARKCSIKEIDSTTKNEFLNKWHIQGEDKSSVKLGLVFDDELVAVMTFGKPRFNKNFEWELIRYATSKHVIGGAGKLLAYFKKNYLPRSIITYADKCWSQGNMYRKIGFEQLNDSGPGYFYVKDNIVYTRVQCQKHKLKKLLGDKFNEQLTESENMAANGFVKIYDCGNCVFCM